MPTTLEEWIRKNEELDRLEVQSPLEAWDKRMSQMVESRIDPAVLQFAEEFRETADDDLLQQVPQEMRSQVMEAMNTLLTTRDPIELSGPGKVYERLSRAHDRAWSNIAQVGREYIPGVGDAEYGQFARQMEGMRYQANPASGETLLTEALLDAVEQAPNLIASAAAQAAAGPIGIGAYWTMQTTPDALDDLRAAGFDNTTAMWTAPIIGVGEAAIETWSKPIDVLTGGQLKRAMPLAKGKGREWAINRIKNAGIQWGKEFTEEGLQDFWRNMAMEGLDAVNDDVEFPAAERMKEFWEPRNLAELGISLLAMGTPGGIATAAKQYRQQKDQLQQEEYRGFKQEDFATAVEEGDKPADQGEGFKNLQATLGIEGTGRTREEIAAAEQQTYPVGEEGAITEAPKPVVTEETWGDDFARREPEKAAQLVEQAPVNRKVFEELTGEKKVPQKKRGTRTEQVRQVLQRQAAEPAVAPEEQEQPTAVTPTTVPAEMLPVDQEKKGIEVPQTEWEQKLGEWGGVTVRVAATETEDVDRVGHFDPKDDNLVWVNRPLAERATDTRDAVARLVAHEVSHKWRKANKSSWRKFASVVRSTDKDGWATAQESYSTAAKEQGLELDQAALNEETLATYLEENITNLGVLEKTFKADFSLWERFVATVKRTVDKVKGNKIGQQLLTGLESIGKAEIAPDQRVFSEQITPTEPGTGVDLGAVTVVPDARAALRRKPLANPAVTPEAREFVEEVDKKMGAPEVLKDVDVRQKADVMLKDYAGAKQIVMGIAKGGGQLNPEQTVAAKDIIDREATKAFKTGKIEEATRITEAYRGTRTEQARSLRLGFDPKETPQQRNKRLVQQVALQMPQKMSKKLQSAQKNGDTATADKLVKQWEKKFAGIQKQLAVLGVDLANLDRITKSRVATARLVNEIHKAKGDSYIMREYWRNAILSLPTTQAANIIGNTGNAIWRMGAERIVQGVTNVATRNPDAAQLGELKWMLRGILPGFSAGLKNMKEAWASELPQLDSTYRIETPNISIKGKKGRIIRAPQRGLLAMDELMKTMFARMEVAALAYREAKKQKLTKARLARYINDQVQDSSSEAWDRAIEEAKITLFQEDIKDRKLSSALQYLRNNVPGMYYVMPFLFTPLNIYRTGFRKLPGIGAMRYLFSGGRTAPDWMQQMLGEQITGMIVVLALMGMIGDEDDPQITGTMDEKDYRTRTAANRGIQPQSVKIGDKWYSYSRIEPFATVIATLVDTINAFRSGRTDRMIDVLPRSVLNQVHNKTFLSGLSDVMQAMEDPQRAAPKFVSRFAASWVPNVIRGAGRATQEEYQQRGVWGDWSSGEWFKMLGKRTLQSTEISGLKDRPRIDEWGRENERTSIGMPVGDWLFRMVVPVRSKRANLHIGDRMMASWNLANPDEKEYVLPPLKYWKSRPLKGRKAQQVYMTEDEYHRLAKYGGMLAARLVALHAPQDPSQPTAADMKLLKSNVRKANALVRSLIKKERLGEKTNLEDTDALVEKVVQDQVGSLLYRITGPSVTKADYDDEDNRWAYEQVMRANLDTAALRRILHAKVATRHYKSKGRKEAFDPKGKVPMLSTKSGNKALYQRFMRLGMWASKAKKWE